MKNLYILIFEICLFSFFYSCSEKNKSDVSNGFRIDGSVQNVKDSSWVYLEPHNNKILDSSMVINGKFVLTGKIKSPTISVLILKYHNNFLEDKFFWVENKKIKFEAVRGKFQDAKISGSATQLEEDILDKAIFPLRKQEDSVMNLKQKTNDKIEKAKLNEEFRRLHGQEKETIINYIKKYPASLVSVFTLNIYKTTWGKDKTSDLFNNLSAEMKLTPEGRLIDKYLKINVEPRIGDNYVDFELPDSAGNPVKLSDIKGKVVLLDFWAAWCFPCREENSELVKTYSQYHSKGFEVLGVSGDDDRQMWLDAIKKDGLVWKNVSDLKGTESNPFLIYGIYGIPDNFLIDKNGKIIGRNLRGNDLRNKLKQLLD